MECGCISRCSTPSSCSAARVAGGSGRRLRCVTMSRGVGDDGLMFWCVWRRAGCPGIIADIGRVGFAHPVARPRVPHCFCSRMDDVYSFCASGWRPLLCVVSRYVRVQDRNCGPVRHVRADGLRRSLAGACENAVAAWFGIGGCHGVRTHLAVAHLTVGLHRAFCAPVCARRIISRWSVMHAQDTNERAPTCSP